VRARPAIAAVALAALAAGCGAAQSAHPPAAQAPVDGALLATSVATESGSWAVVVMGGSASSHNNFWQLFLRPAGSAEWRLVTPPGTADNGGLVLAPTGGQSMVAAFRPSQDLTFTPLAGSSDSGRTWGSAGPLDASLADVPDALAAGSRGNDLIAVTGSGGAATAVPPYTDWKTVATVRTLAATAAGRRCTLTDLTAVAYAPSGNPLLAGSCARAGTVGIFAEVGGTWEDAGPVTPADLAGQHITVLRLDTIGTQTVALLQAGSGNAASLVTAWSAGPGGRWVLSRPLGLDKETVASASLGEAGTVSVLTSTGSAAVIAPAGAWRDLPAVPSGTATLAMGAGGEIEALSVNRGTLTVWSLEAGGTAWTRVQVIRVPIQYGSSS